MIHDYFGIDFEAVWETIKKQSSFIQSSEDLIRFKFYRPSRAGHCKRNTNECQRVNSRICEELAEREFVQTAQFP
jgi:hypothetical protein